MEDIYIPLQEGAVKGFSTYHKISTKEELYRELASLKTKMQPFLERHAPVIQETDEKIVLSEFSYSLDGGEPSMVTVPHYGGPIGRHTALYETTFLLNTDEDKKYFIAFGGVDYKCKVFVNDIFVGQHEGFFAPFELEFTAAALPGQNTLKIYVENDYIMQGNQIDGYAPDNIEANGDKIYAATGMGWDEPNIGWHHCPPGMGIYQKVHIITRNKEYISDIFPRVNEDSSEIHIECFGDKPEDVPVEFTLSLYGYNFKETCFEDIKYIPNMNTYFEEAAQKQLYLENGYNRFIVPIHIAEPKIWTPDTPYLYLLKCTMLVDNVVKSVKTCRFGIRTFKQDTTSTPRGKFYLNGKEIRLLGANTMGFEQQDVFKEDYTQLTDDILLAKLCNMNFLRITQRPVQPEVYDYCDMLGMMVQTDFPTFAAIRLNQFNEIIKQVGEMEALVRSHPCCIMDTYINEPSPQCDGRPHRHMSRSQLESLFDAMDIAVKMKNPDRVIKHVDGDYDPPCKSMPDNHLYNLWYNGHAVDFGKMHKGGWCQVKEGWHIGCGEFGTEGLDFPEIMRTYYPKEWITEPFKPNKIIGAQTWNFHNFFYETPDDSMEAWSLASHSHQAFATKMITSALRRNKLINTFAIHLFIDAFPSGWMKAIMDFKRNPKPAYFVYRDCCEPVFCNIRSDRFTFFEQETISLESYICCDDMSQIEDVAYMVSFNNEIIYSARKKATKDFFQGYITFETPSVEKRSSMTVYMGAFADGKLIHYNTETFEIFPRFTSSLPQTMSYQEYDKNSARLDQEIFNGKRILINALKTGEYFICNETVTARKCGMSPLYFVSRDTGHPLVDGFAPNDFRFFYDRNLERIAPLLTHTIYSENALPILKTANKTDGLHKAQWSMVYACCEIPYGKGSVIINQLLLEDKTDNPIAAAFLTNLEHYIHH